MAAYQFFSKSIEKLTRKRAQMCLLSRSTVTSIVGQGHSHGYMNTVWWCLLSHHVWKKLACKCLNTSQCKFIYLFIFLIKSPKLGSLLWILIKWDKLGMRLITPTNLNTMPNSALGENCNKMFFLHTCDLKSKSSWQICNTKVWNLQNNYLSTASMRRVHSENWDGTGHWHIFPMGPFWTIMGKPFENYNDWRSLVRPCSSENELQKPCDSYKTKTKQTNKREQILLTS